MELVLSDIVLIVGSCGSGKTEVSINLALDQKNKGFNVKVVDLDLVNPYFRTREVKKLFYERGIQLALPPDKYLYADLPILSPLVSGFIKSSPELLIIDVGGGSIGSTVLGALSCFLKGKNIRMLCVVNPNRPYTDTLTSCLKMCREIEVVAKIKITGIIGNSNLMDYTTVDTIYSGYEFVLKLSNIMNIPLSFITIPITKILESELDKIKCPFLRIERKLLPPWL